MESWCTHPGCERQSDRGRPLCPMHAKRQQRGSSMDAPVMTRLPPKERLLELCNALADASSDEDFKRTVRAIDDARKDITAEEHSATIKRALARARAAGKPHGRPPKITPEEATRLVKRWGSMVTAATRARVSLRTIQRALSRNDKNRVFVRRIRACPRNK